MRYTARLELNTGEDIADELADTLAQFRPAVSLTGRGKTEVVLTMQARTLTAAITSALAAAEAATGAPVLVAEVMPAREYERRELAEGVVEPMTVTQAARAMRVSPQALRQRLELGTLRGRKTGSTWLIPAAETLVWAALVNADGVEVTRVRLRLGEPYEHEGRTYVVTQTSRQAGRQPTVWIYREAA